ncbi:MAG: hypothetical protein AAF662_14115 [Pseudomonadota bacterium]
MTPLGSPRQQKVLVLATGSYRYGDDAMAVALLQSISHRDETIASQATLIADSELRIEHTLELCGKDLVLFIGAVSQSNFGSDPCSTMQSKPRSTGVLADQTTSGFEHGPSGSERVGYEGVDCELANPKVGPPDEVKQEAHSLAGRVELQEIPVEGLHALMAANAPITPPDLLHVLKTLDREATPPRCFQLALHGANFERNSALSDTAKANLEDAKDLLLRLLKACDPAVWLSFAGVWSVGSQKTPDGLH